MKEWHKILRRVLEHGEQRPDRTGVGTLSLFGAQVVFDNSTSFPAFTTKKLFFESVKAELSAFLHGYDTLDQFHSVGCSIWDGNGTADYWTTRQHYRPGYLGRIYGVQWRRWKSYLPLPQYDGLKAALSGNAPAFKVTDQLRNLVDGLRNDPFGRRHLVTAWNPGELDQMCLPPCHVLFQCYVSGVRAEIGSLRLDLRVDMRSVDLFLGLPFDVASYALLQRLLAKEVGMEPGRLIFQLGDAHVYLNHLDQVRTVLAREPFLPPQLRFDEEETSPFNFKPHHASLVDYEHHPAVKAPMNV